METARLDGPCMLRTDKAPENAGAFRFPFSRQLVAVILIAGIWRRARRRTVNQILAVAISEPPAPPAPRGWPRGLPARRTPDDCYHLPCVGRKALLATLRAALAQIIRSGAGAVS